MRPSVIAITNGKGGVGKTSTTANLAGQAAEAGWKTLIVDLDPQGNVGRDLGYYKDPERDDQGAGLYESMQWPDRPLPLLEEVRPNLDVVVGGPMLMSISALEGTWSRQGRDPKMALADVLLPVAANYHLTVIDCPPGERFLQELALCASRWVLIPTRSDEASLDGLDRVGATLQEVWKVNHELEILGVLMFGINGVALEREVRQKVTEGLGDVAPVLKSKIPYLEAPATTARNMGLLAHEYERDMVRTAPKFWEKKRTGQSGPRIAGASSANKLALQYAKLSEEVLSVIFASQLQAAEQ